MHIPRSALMTAAAAGAAAAAAATAARESMTPAAASAAPGGGGGAGGGKVLKAFDVSKIPGLAKTGPGDLYANDRDFAVITVPSGAPPVARSLRAANRTFTRGDSKKILAAVVDQCWPVIKKYYSLEDWQKTRFVALMLGQSTAESTLRVDIETAIAKGYNKDSAHSYGLLQTAVTAFAGANPAYDQEDDVPELYRYPFTPENFYGAVVSTFMGIRKMLHFAVQAKTKYNVKDKWDVLRLAVQGHNIGHANPGNPDSYMAGYPDMCARMGEFYFTKGHMTDDVFTWTGHHAKTWPGDTSDYPAPAMGSEWRKNWAWFWTK